MKGIAAFAGTTLLFSFASLTMAEVGMTESLCVPINGKAAASASAIAVSGDGRFVAFASSARNLANPDSQGVVQIFLRDRILGKTELVSISPSGAAANGACEIAAGAVSFDGRYIAFTSSADNLGGSGTQVYVRDRVSKVTVVASATASVLGNGVSRFGKISADGSIVAFVSSASNLVGGDVNGAADVFVRDMATGELELGNALTGGLPTLGVPANSPREPFSLSDDGRFLAFETISGGLSASESFGTLYFRDLSSGQTQPFLFLQGKPVAPRVSAGGRYASFEADGKVYGLDRDSGASTLLGTGTLLDISGDGSTVVLCSNDGLVWGDNDGKADIYAYHSGLLKLVSVNDDGSEASGDARAADVSADGMFVPFLSNAQSLTGSSNLTLAFMRVRGLSFALTPGSVVGGATVSGKLVLDQPAPAATTFALSKSSGALRAPISVTVPQGSSAVEFACPTQGVDSAVNARATLGNIASKWVSIAPAQMTSFKLSASQVYGGSGTIVKGVVTLDGKAGPAGISVNVLTTNPLVIAPVAVTIPAGAKSVSFAIEHQLTSQDQDCTVTVTVKGRSLSAQLRVLAVRISGFSFSPSTVTVGGSTVGTVTLNAPAPAEGFRVFVSSDKGMSGTVLIVAPGEKTRSFAFTAPSDGPVGTWTFTASFNGSTKKTTLIVK